MVQQVTTIFGRQDENTMAVMSNHSDAMAMKLTTLYYSDAREALLKAGQPAPAAGLSTLLVKNPHTALAEAKDPAARILSDFTDHGIPTLAVSSPQPGTRRGGTGKA